MKKEDLKNKDNNNNIDIELDEKIAEGVYSNLAFINHSNSEFVLDFIQVLHGVPKARIKSRIILTPEHAKSFVKAMSDNLKKYENTYGSIRDNTNEHNIIEEEEEEDTESSTISIPITFGPVGEA